MQDLKFSRAYVEITNVCNHSCSFCPGTKRKPHFMKENEFSHVLDSLNGITEYIYLHLMGEPLLHPEIINFIKLASSLSFKCALTTNGTLLEKMGNALLTSGVYKVNISLHSFENGTSKQHSDYINNCISFADRAAASGILSVLRLWNVGYDEGRNDNVLTVLKQRFENEWAEGKRGARIKDKLHLEYAQRFDWPNINIESLGDRVFCHGLGDHFGILSDGTVVPCCLDKDGEMALGNVFDAPLAEILTSDRAKKIIEGFSKKRATEELCKRCGYARRFRI